MRLITALPEDFVLMNSSSLSHNMSSGNGFTSDGKFVKVDLEIMIDKIYLAPFSSNDFDSIVQTLTEKFAPNLTPKIKKSNLYSFR